MKKNLALVAFLPVLLACQNETKQLLITIDGRWQVNTVTYTNQSGRDSVATPVAIQLQFDNCSKAANDRGPSNCLAEYIENNQPFRFAYQATNGKKSIYISPLNPVSDPVYREVSDRLAGSYQVKQLTGNSLVIRRSMPGNPGDYQAIEYSASK